MGIVQAAARGPGRTRRGRLPRPRPAARSGLGGGDCPGRCLISATRDPAAGALDVPRPGRDSDSEVEIARASQGLKV